MNYYKLFIILINACVIQISHAEKPSINILTWWGYLDSPWISDIIDRQCNVTLSYDSYNSNAELLRKWSEGKSKYDIIIFSDTVYSAIKKDLPLKNSKLYQQAKFYNNTIRNHYKLGSFPPNVTYFLHSLTGFIWNPSIINLKNDETVLSAFKKAKNNMVVVIDDSVEAQMLMHNSRDTSKKGTLNFITFKQTTQNAKIFVSNQLNQIYDQKNFAFAYQWSGIALAELLNKNNYQFLINKNLSYISTDLIAQINNTNKAACVSTLMTSRNFLSRMQNELYYFSPFGDISTVKNEKFKYLYREFLKKLPKLTWIASVNQADLKYLDYQWDTIKYELSK